MRPMILTVVLAVLVAACGSSPAPVAPTPTPAPTAITYAINIPNALQAVELQRDNPNGVLIAPIEAQRQWDFTAAYQGSPNVYFGETAPWQGFNCAGAPIPIAEYMNTGIVVAPATVADLETFTSRDWPGIGLEPGVTYMWLGRFTYSAPAMINPGSPCPGK